MAKGIEDAYQYVGCQICEKPMATYRKMLTATCHTCKDEHQCAIKEQSKLQHNERNEREGSEMMKKSSHVFRLPVKPKVTTMIVFSMPSMEVGIIRVPRKHWIRRQQTTLPSPSDLIVMALLCHHDPPRNTSYTQTPIPF